MKNAFSSTGTGTGIKYTKNLRRKCQKNCVKIEFGKMKTIQNMFFLCLPNFRAHALQSELSKVSISNFVKFQLQSMSSKVEQAFEKNDIF